MEEMKFISDLVVGSDSRMILLVMDGLGGLPHPETGLTELETARTPNLDALAAKSVCGLSYAVARGVTPGSGPGHLALFGYDPFRFEIGRGVLAAIGSGIKLGKEDLAARVNFCTVEGGKIVDRRAGRISTDENARLCARLADIRLEGAEAEIRAEKEHRAALVFRGENLSDQLTDTDPQRNGLAPLACEPLPGAGADAEKTAKLVNTYLERAGEILAGEHPANMIITRGYSKLPDIPAVTDLYSIRAAAIANYPMYRAVSELVGMDLLDTGESFSEKVDSLEHSWKDYDYFFIHYKHTDSRGEDGDFDRKVECIEEVDAQIPRIMELDPDVVVVTGDHSTPALLKSHSWHPSPLLLYSRWERRDAAETFGESACSGGGLGHFQASAVMSLMLANALRLKKFGA